MEGVDDGHSMRGMSVTIKVPESKRYAADNPWLVFHGRPAVVADMIREAFGLDPDKELSVFELALNAQDAATKIGTLRAGLGGATVISSGGSTPPAEGGNAWSQAGSTPAAPEKTELELEIERLTPAVEKVTTVAELQELWARNQEAFKDATLMAAYKAKGKSLSA